MAKPLIQLKQVSKSYGQEVIVKDINLSIYKGETIAILGKSGCGKSTLLNMIGGFDKPTSGTITMNQNEVKSPSKTCVMLMQDYGLLPWRSVQKNIELALEGLPLSRQQRSERALHYLKMVGLDDKLDALPHELSGGMQQRVAIARALAIQPEVILMDEPFAALDALTRYYLQDELVRLQHNEQATILLVTHDIEEAIYLADRIYLMESQPGRIFQEITIPKAKPRDRADRDFQHYRKLILEQFQTTHLDRLHN